MAAWFVRDAVETASFLVSRCSISRDQRRLFEAARHTAESAALGLLVGDRLPVRDLDVLCAPFGVSVTALAHGIA
jgi:hypothetical protein